jgi:hypothetical protein
VSESSPIDLGQQDAGAVLDYRIKFKNVPSGQQLDDQECTVESAGNSESPPALMLIDSAIVADGSGRQIEVLFWLKEGTPGVRYLIKVVASDSESVDPDRQYVEYATIEIT